MLRKSESASKFFCCQLAQLLAVSVATNEDPQYSDHTRASFDLLTPIPQFTFMTSDCIVCAAPGAQLVSKHDKNACCLECMKQ